MSRHQTGSIHEIEGVIGQVISEHNVMKKKNSDFEGKLNKIERMIQELSTNKGRIVTDVSSSVNSQTHNKNPSISYTNKFNSISRKHFTTMSGNEEYDEEETGRSALSDLTQQKEEELMAKLFSNHKLRTQKSDDHDEE